MRRIPSNEGKYESARVKVDTPCDKIGYKRRKDAARAAATARRESGESSIRPYRCPNGCHLWHIGHMPYWAHKQQFGA